MAKKIAILSTSRADFYIYLPLLREIIAHPHLDLELILTGTHLSPHYEFTAVDVESLGIPVAERVEVTLSSATPSGVAKTMGLATLGLAEVFQRRQPDILLTLGDRSEMLAAALAAVPFNIIIGHIHGGECSSGAIDDVWRHCLTKISHLHFVAHPEYQRRVIQMGEAPERVFLVGALALDQIAATPRLSLGEISERLGFHLESTPVLVTLHPETRSGQTVEQLALLQEMLGGMDGPFVISCPNADVGGVPLLRMWEDWVKGRQAYLASNLGELYYPLMAVARCMIGNSSSGVIEAASFALPVLDLGDRQAGRLRGANVMHAPFEAHAMKTALEKVLEMKPTAENPLSQGGNAAAKIAACLKSWDGGAKKSFYEGGYGLSS